MDIFLRGKTPHMAGTQETVLMIGELAGYLKLSKSTLYHLARAGRIPGQKVGRHWRFHRDAIDRWLKRQEKPRRK